jgi:diguanylate cyclase (GGDEF)-like protein
MTPFIQYLTGLTALRNRDEINAALATGLTDLFAAQCTAIHTTVGKPDDRRWLTLFHSARGGTVVAVDDAIAGQLPPLKQYPGRCAALAGEIIDTVKNGRHQTLFPFAKDGALAGVLEMHTGASLSAQARIDIGTMLQVYSNLQGLLDYSQRDSLTGLLNRKTFDDGFFKARSAASQSVALPPAERRVADDNARHWVGMVDIDFFKAVNDRFGHLIGDEVLLLVAQLLTNSCRAHDLVYRFGGEEFVVLIQCSRPEEAAKVFERLRRNTERFNFPRVGSVTVSIGFTELHGTDSPTSALGRADKAVYAAKGNGRNQIQNFADIAERDSIAVVEETDDVELFE